MNTTRRVLVIVAATAIAVTGLAPAASAQLGGGLGLGLVERTIAATDCRVADPILRGAFAIDDTTTRSDLAKQIRDEAKPLTITDPRTYLLSAQFAGQIADKAVSCGTVKPDPQSLIPGSSNLGDIQDILTNLSSTLQPK